ncbi:hypothetical protein ACFQE5_18320 [Pseudonocardia hispaniensis]|uniref:MYXO-CTERM domain-containing protein n=1 Tax=Pseudonocardia hispaniensis TaxID=904933 RepID=A0ABW1J5M9_9PSEU
MHPTLRRAGVRADIVLGSVAAAAIGGAVPAFAHVTAQPGTAAKGGYTVINFRVPDESDTGAEPAHPAPTVRPTAAAADDPHSDPPPAVGTDTMARWPAGAGLLVGVLGLGAGGAAARRGRNRKVDS